MVFSTKQYDFSQVSVNIGGKTIRGLRGLEYEVKVGKSFLHGRGRDPMSIQTGNYEYHGALSLTQSELIAITEAIKANDPEARIPDYAFDITVAYSNTTKITTDIIRAAEFTGYKKEMKQGDGFMEIKLNFLALQIDENV